MADKQDRLAEILADHNGAHPDRTYVTLVSNPDIYWLITENGRLRAALEELVHIGPSSTMGDFKRAQARGLEVLGRDG
jgi:hypothetical protein